MSELSKHSWLTTRNDCLHFPFHSFLILPLLIFLFSLFIFHFLYSHPPAEPDTLPSILSVPDNIKPLRQFDNAVLPLEDWERVR
jgi:hypothetical protein